MANIQKLQPETKKICSSCGGSGWKNPSVKCTACKGKGTIIKQF